MVIMRSLIGNIIIAAFLSVFVFVSVRQFYATGDVGYILVAVNEAVYVVLYLLREHAVATSTSKFDWAIAFSATFLATLLRPANPYTILIGDTLIVIGTVVNIVSVLYLNRSIGIVPAERSIKTGGIYRYVRHPMYSSGILILFGYLLANVSLANALIVLANTALLCIRAEREELFLSRNELYRAYVANTPWQLLPFVY